MDTVTRTNWDVILATQVRQADLNDTSIRIVPLVLTDTVPHFLERRAACFTSLKYEQLPSKAWQVQTVRTILGTMNRDRREVTSTFNILTLSPNVSVLLATMHGDMYHHGAGLLEKTAFPFALRPYIPLLKSTDLCIKALTKAGFEAQITNFRAESMHTSEGMQVRGHFHLSNVRDRIAAQRYILKTVRLRAIDQEHDGEVRFRLDPHCRILIEKWSTAFSTSNLIEELVDHFSATLQATIPKRHKVSDSNTYLGEISLNNYWTFEDFEEFTKIYLSQRGILVSSSVSESDTQVYVVDFLSGTNCSIELVDGRKLFCYMKNSFQGVFIDRLTSLINEYECEMETIVK